MKPSQCSICKTVGLAKWVDASAELTASGLSLASAALFAEPVSAERIRTHRKHRAAEMPTKQSGERKTDFAVRVRDRAVEQFDLGQLDLRNKDAVPGISAGLKAQSILDTREKTKSKTQTAELAFAILAMLTGHAPPQLALDDGNVIEGEAYEIEPDGETD